MRRDITEVICDACLNDIRNREVGYGKVDYETFIVEDKQIDICRFCYGMVARLRTLGIIVLANVEQRTQSVEIRSLY